MISTITAYLEEHHNSKAVRIESMEAAVFENYISGLNIDTKVFTTVSVPKREPQPDPNSCSKTQRWTQGGEGETPVPCTGTVH